MVTKLIRVVKLNYSKYELIGLVMLTVAGIVLFVNA